MKERLEKLEEFKSLEGELGVVFYSKELGLFLKPLERLLNKLRHDYPDWKFIIMIKEPVDENLLKKLKLKELKEEKFFASTEKIQDLAIVKYDLVEFSSFKEKIKPKLISICEKFLSE